MTNRAFEDLEKRCKAINRKVFLKWFLLSLIVIFPTGIFVYNSYFSINDVNYLKEAKKLKDTILFHKNIVKKPIMVSNKKVDINKTVVIKDKSSKLKKTEVYQTILLKSNIVLPKIKHKAKRRDSNDAKKNKIEKIATNKIKAPKIVEDMTKPPKLVETKNIEKPKKIKILVKTMQDEQSLLKVYNRDKNFDSSLNLSVYYFKNKKYTKAIFYSKEANRYNPSSANPWLVYAKSKVKLNKKKDAIKALETYLSYFDSSDAKSLLLATKDSI